MILSECQFDEMQCVMLQAVKFNHTLFKRYLKMWLKKSKTQQQQKNKTTDNTLV